MDLVFTPSDFVAVLNQTLEYAYPLATIEGELANLRIARGKWVYFDIKDEYSSVKCFGALSMLPGPLEAGLMVRIVASPRLHPQYNFSLNLQSVTPVGEGSLKRAADLLQAKLSAEGLFDPARKRPLPFAPEHIGLVTSRESAAYADFVKILDERWVGMRVTHYDCQVQGEPAVSDIVNAIVNMNQLAQPPEVLVITRGGGSADDLAAFNTEQVVRAIATSRIPTLVAIGHEVDVSLAELAADRRASTPSNAVQLLTPDKSHILQTVKEQKRFMGDLLEGQMLAARQSFIETSTELKHWLEQAYMFAKQTLIRQTDLLQALNPEAALARGYAVLRSEGRVVKSVKLLEKGSRVSVQLQDGSIEATVDKVHL